MSTAKIGESNGKDGASAVKVGEFNGKEGGDGCKTETAALGRALWVTHKDGRRELCSGCLGRPGGVSSPIVDIPWINGNRQVGEFFNPSNGDQLELMLFEPRSLNDLKPWSRYAKHAVEKCGRADIAGIKSFLDADIAAVKSFLETTYGLPLRDEDIPVLLASTVDQTTPLTNK